MRLRQFSNLQKRETKSHLTSICVKFPIGSIIIIFDVPVDIHGIGKKLKLYAQVNVIVDVVKTMD